MKTQKIIKASSPDFNRKALERGGFDILFAPEEVKLPHSHKKPGICLDYISLKSAKKHNIAIAFNLENLKSLKKEEKAIICSRIKNIIKLCRKEKVKLAIKGNFKALLQELGASSTQLAEKNILVF